MPLSPPSHDGEADHNLNQSEAALIRERILDRFLKIIVLVRKGGRLNGFEPDASLARAACPQNLDVHLHYSFRSVVFEFFRNPWTQRDHPVRLDVLHVAFNCSAAGGKTEREVRDS